MKFKSAILSQASGSLGGATYSHNRGGMYIRNRSLPTNPNTSFQQAVRNALAQLAQLWGTTLDAAQREGWETYAANVPVINSLGDTINLTGLNMYTRSNVPRIQAGLPRVDDAPTEYNLGNETAPTISAVAAATDQIAIGFNDADNWVDEDDSALIVFCSRPQSPTINSFIGPYRFADVVAGDSSTPPTDPTTIDLPFAVTAGQKIFASIRLSRADGRLSNPFRLSGVGA